MDQGPTQNARTFISYAREDSEFALKLAGDLRRAGASIWLDRFDIPVGKHWPQAVEEALDSCSQFLAILSPASVGSHNVIAELNFALDEGKRIFPVLCHECRRPFRIRALQYADFTGDYDRGFGELRKALGVERKPEEPAVPVLPLAGVLEREQPAPISAVDRDSAASTIFSIPATTTATQNSADPSDAGEETARVGKGFKGKLLATLKGHTKSIIHAEFSPDGQRIVTGSIDKTARVWDAANGILLARLKGHTTPVSHAEFSPDGQRIVTDGVDKVRVWEAANGKLLAVLKGHTRYIYSAEFSPDGQRIVTASSDKTA
jgi:hypothetical protein